MTDFKEISKRPKGKPDYVSYYFDKTGKRKISSEYWYNENGAVRESDHWGEGISSWAVINVEKEKKSFYLHKVAILNKKEDETLFKTGNSQKATPSDISSSIYSLFNKLQIVNNTDTKFSLDVDRFSNDLRNIQLWQYDGYEYFSKVKEFYQQKSDIFHCHVK